MNKKDIIYYGIVLILLCAILYMIHIMKSETAQCLRNPYLYGAKQMENVECYCSQFKQFSQCPAKFSFNDTFFNNTPTKCSGGDPRFKEMDWSIINISTSQ